MKKTFKNRLKLLMLLIITLVTLTGCGEHLQTFVETDLRDMVTARIVANQECAMRLFNSGLITQSEYDNIMVSLEEKEKALLNADEGEASSQKAMFSSIAAFRTVKHIPLPGEDVNKFGYTEDDWDEFIVTNAIQQYNTQIPGYENLNAAKGTGTVVPISIIDEATGSDINARFGFPIYVLKTAADLGGSLTEMPLDEISEMVNMAITDPNNIDLAILDKYFTPALDADGNRVTLLDTEKRENKVVVTSDGIRDAYVNSPDHDDAPNKVNEAMGGFLLYPGDTYTNRPGKDMIVSQLGFELFSLRFSEFNKDAIDKIINTLGLSDEKYLITADGAGGRVYLLEYPSHNVDTFKEDGDKFEAIFAQSNLGVNLKTGAFAKYSGAWNESDNGVSTSGVSTLNTDPYLTLLGATNNTDVAHASFSLYGDTEMVLGEKNITVNIGRVILKDYLEATYAPGVVSGENVVLFGRKLRLENISGTKDTVVASFYNKLGRKLDVGGNLFINDFADIESLVSDTPEIKFIKGKGEADITAPAPDPLDPLNSENGNSQNPSNEELIQDAIRKIDTLPLSSTDEIKASLPFPGKDIGRVDNSESETPYFYAMVVRKGMFHTGLFSGWIYNTEEDGNSLTWWNNWLYENQYQYKIDKTILEEYLVGNYAYELGKHGILVLDLETISKIQEEYKEQDIVNKNRAIRTMFMLLGAFIIGYALIMLLAWVLDTNVDLGFNILDKMTFGNYVAVVDESEVPFIDTDSTRYIGFSNLAIRSCIMVVIGIVLILVDFMEIGYWLIQIFGGVAKMISRILNQL